MFARKRVLLALLSVVLVPAVAYAARAPVDANAPITMTKGMYADLLCIAASEFDPVKGGVEFIYDPASDTIFVKHRDPTNTAGVTNVAQALAMRKSSAKEQANFKLGLLLPKLQQHVSPAASPAFEGF